MATVRLNVLVGEDNPADVLLMREAFRMENLSLEVYVASDGEQAVDFIRNSEGDPAAPSPHVVLLDLNLPRVDGFDVLRRIRASERYKSLPAIIVSSSDSSSDRSEALRLGAAYFCKPPDYQAFLKIGPTLRRFLLDKGLL